MLRPLSIFLSVCFLCLSFSVQSSTAENIADQEIKQLIAAVKDSQCAFVRNGSTHDSETAASHLQLKYKNGKKYASSAEAFIDRLATKSSWTGKVYTMQCPNQDEQPSGLWLHQRLALIRQV